MMITVNTRHLSINAQATTPSYNIPIWRTQVFGRQNCNHCSELALDPSPLGKRKLVVSCSAGAVGPKQRVPRRPICKIFSASMPVYMMRRIIARDFFSFSMLGIGAIFTYILIKNRSVKKDVKTFEFKHEF